MLRNRLLWAFLLALLSSSSHAQDSTRAVPLGPCDDPRYLELKKKPLDGLSEEEFRYVKNKGKECDETLKLRMLAAPVPVTGAPSQATTSGSSRLDASSQPLITTTRARTAVAWGRGFYLTAAFGEGWTSQGDVNSIIKAQAQVLKSAGISVNWRNFSVGPEFSGELGYRLTPRLTIAVGGAHQSQVADNHVSDYTGSFQDSYTTSINELVGTIALAPFYSPVFSIGGSAGVGFGTLKEEYAFHNFADPSNDLVASGDWSGSGFVGAVFVGLSHALGDAVEIQARAGYKYRNLGTFDGTVTSPQYGTVSQGPQNPPGHLLEIDYSGLYALAGFGFRMGGSR